MAAQTPFSPALGTNQILTATVVPQFIALHPKAKSVRVLNVGDVIGYVRIGIGVTTASTADVPITSQTDVILYKGDDDNSLGYYSLGTTLQVQVGEGGI